MTPDILLTYAVIVAALVAMAREWLPADLVLLSAMGVLIAGGVVELEEALVGFAEPTLLALGSLFVMAAGLRQTGVLRRGADLLFGEGRRLRSVLFRLTGAASTGSAFLNNTPIVAMGIPAVLAWSRERQIPPSKLLIPLSYASILGGVCTLIGTSTNLVADGMLRERGMEGLGFFELGALGLPLAVVGLVYLVVVAPAILGERAHPDTEVMEGTVASDIHLMQVPEGSGVVGRSVAEAGLGKPELQLMRLIRSDGSLVHVTPDTPILAGDRLTFRGAPSDMATTAGRAELEAQEVADLPEFADEADLREAVIAPGSDLAGEELHNANFAERFAAVVIGVVRDGRQTPRLEGLNLRAGDVLLMVARPEFAHQFADSRHLHLLSGEDAEVESEAGVPLWQPTRARMGLAIMAAVVGLATFGVFHISLAALAGAILMVLMGFLSPAEARQAVDWSVLIVIGAAVGLGAALETSGGAAILAEGIVSMGQSFGPRGVLAALVAGTMLLTLTITNNAAVAILIPVAVAVASTQGIAARPLVVAVTVGASMAFATPVGYQTNLMVYGPGGYTFGDFVRAGLPLQIIMAAVSVLVIPWIWSF